jgi:hypothetical protein
VRGALAPAAADTGAVGAAAPVSAARRDTAATGGRRRAAHVSFLKSPTGIMLRSVVVPGWGQATNGAWVKAVAVAGVEGLLISALVSDTRKLGRLSASDPEYTTVFDRRQRNAWWLGFTVALSMVDAYVDAQLKGTGLELGPEPPDNPVSLRLTVRLP